MSSFQPTRYTEGIDEGLAVTSVAKAFPVNVQRHQDIKISLYTAAVLKADTAPRITGKKRFVASLPGMTLCQLCNIFPRYVTAAEHNVIRP